MRAVEEAQRLRTQYEALKAESASWQSMTGGMLEEKELEISRLLEENARLQAQVAEAQERARKVCPLWPYSLFLCTCSPILFSWFSKPCT